jgi:hypothetical protein
MKIKENIIIACTYSAIVIGFSFWWAENFASYVNSKGDEYFFEIKFVGIVTICISIILKLVNRELSWRFIIAMPFLIGLLSIFVTMFMPFIQKITVNDLRVYGIAQSILTIITVYAQLRSDNRKILGNT